MARLGYVPSLLCAEFVMGRVCHVPILLCAELSLNRFPTMYGSFLLRIFQVKQNDIGWRLKPEILAQGGLNVNERHHGYYWSLVHTHQLQGR